MVTGAGILERKLAEDTNLLGLVRSLAAYRRVEVLVQHLKPQSSIGAVPVQERSSSSHSHSNSDLMLVPLPGTFEHDQWQNVLAASLPQSPALSDILRTWREGFSAGDSRLSRALRRVRVIAAHLAPMTQRLALEI